MPDQIAIQDLRKDYVTADQVTPVLKGATLRIVPGEFVAIMGPSGSGKSTLMHILGFLDVATTGTYHFGGKDVSQLSEAELADMRQSSVGFVFQAFFLLPHLSVRENVELPMVYSSTLSVAARHAAAEKAIAAVGLSHRTHFKAIRLSGGEKQRVAIARALVNNPAVIFADEPTGNLDSASGAQVMALLDALNKDGKTIVLVTHETATAEHAARIIRLKDGHIVADEHVTNRRTATADLGK